MCPHQGSPSLALGLSGEHLPPHLAGGVDAQTGQSVRPSECRQDDARDGVSRSSKAKRAAVQTSRRPCGGGYMLHVESGLIVPARCNSHLCEVCSPLHQMTARLAIEQGILRRQLDHREDRVIWLTLTDRAVAEMDLAALARRWKATVKRLQRTWGATDYALSVEFQGRGALHPHVCIEVDRQVAIDLTDRKSRSSYRRRMHELRPIAEDLGWGQMVDAVTIATGEGSAIAKYAAKSVAGYATKQAKERFKEAGALRVRPIRLSHGWFPGGLAAAREHVLSSERMAAEKLGGTWERIAKPRPC